MNDKEREEVREEARRILNNFSKSLEKVKILEKKKLKKGIGGLRHEGKGASADIDFRQRAFSNAPNKHGDSFIAEKKEW